MAKSNAFLRHPIYFKLIALAAIAAGGWLLVNNIELSRIGLTTVEGWDERWADPACWAMAALEAGLMLLLTQPDYWDDVYCALVDFGGENSHEVPKPIRFALSAVILAGLGAIVFISYRFDFISTLAGLYGPDAEATPNRTMFVLFYNFGSEGLSFIAGQVLRLSKLAQSSHLDESLKHEPANRYNARKLQHMNEAAEQAAEADAQKAWAEFYRQNPDFKPKQHQA